MKAKKSVIANLIGEIPSKAFLFIASIYLARELSVDDFGSWNIILAFITYALLISDWGMTQFGVREIAANRSHHDRVLFQVIKTRLVMQVPLVFVFFSLVFMTYGTDLFWPIIYIYPAIVVSVFFIDWYFKATAQLGYSASMSFISSLIFLIAVLFSPYMGEMNLEYVTLAKSFSFIIFMIIGIVFYYFLIDKTFMKHIIKEVFVIKHKVYDGWYLASSFLFSRLYFSADIVILGLLTSKHEVGIYAGIVLIYNIFTTLRGIVISALSPHFARSLDHLENLKKMLLSWSLLAGLLALILLLLGFFYGKELIVFVLGEQYLSKESFNVLIILSVTLVILSINTMFPNLVILIGESKKYQKVTFYAVLSNIGLNFLVIPLYGMVGAALTTLLAEVIVAIGAMKIFYIHYIKMDRSFG